MAQSTTPTGSMTFTVHIDRDGEVPLTTVTSSTRPDALEIVGLGHGTDIDLLLEAVLTIEEIVLSR